MSWEHITLSPRKSDAELAQELQAKSSVSLLELMICDGSEGETWDNLRQVLASHQGLKRFFLVKDCRGHDFDVEPVVRLLLGALLSNPSVCHGELCDIPLSADLFRLTLQFATVKLHFCRIAPSVVSRSGEEAFVSAIGSSTVESLGVKGCSDKLTCMVFRGSLSNTSLKRLIVAINFPQFFPIAEQVVEELTALLESTTSIEAVEFRNPDAGSGMKRVIKALCNSQTITNVSLSFWSRHLAAEIDSMVNQLILSKTNLKVLEMMHVRATEIFYDSVCSVLLRPNSALSALHFDAHSSSGTAKLLCAAAKTQALHTLVISAPTDQAVVEVLSTNIPALKVKTLTILPQPWFTLKQVQDLWNSVKQNFVLQAVKIDSRYEALERPASSYMTRNKNLAEWNEKPVTLPLILWPEALQMSASSTQTAFFSALRNVVQSGEWNSLQGRRS